MKADHAVKEPTGKSSITCTLDGKPISLEVAKRIIVSKAVDIAIFKLRRLEMKKACGLHGKEDIPI